MKTAPYLLISAFAILACNPSEPEVTVSARNGADDDSDTVRVVTEHKVIVETTVVRKEVPADPVKSEPVPAPKTTGPHANKVFRQVFVERTGENTYRVTGQAQVFEASFSYVVEDGHFQLLKGHEMTDNGAPEWGNFDFSFTLKKKPGANTKPHLILLVYSAKDGSPTHELPIPLPGY